MDIKAWLGRRLKVLLVGNHIHTTLLIQLHKSEEKRHGSERRKYNQIREKVKKEWIQNRIRYIVSSTLRYYKGGVTMKTEGDI